MSIVTRFVRRRMWSRMSGSSNLPPPLNLALGGWDVENPPLVGSFSEKDFHVLQGAAWGCAYIICTPAQHISTQAYYTWKRSGFSWTWQLFHVRIQSTTQHVWPPRLVDTRWPSLRVPRLFMSDSLTIWTAWCVQTQSFILAGAGAGIARMDEHIYW